MITKDELMKVVTDTVDAYNCPFGMMSFKDCLEKLEEIVYEERNEKKEQK